MAPRKTQPRRVWNEDLVRALRARQNQCQQQGRQQQFLWRDGAHIIVAVRNDIYAFSTGRIVGLPETKLTKTVLQLCRDVIAGTAPILPPGYHPSNLQERAIYGDETTTTGMGAAVTNYDNDPYLNRIKVRGGAFALLLAFHVSSSPTMSKTQLCTAAQPFCDEVMEANFHQGRPHGAWSAIKTLERHGLVSVVKAGVAWNDRAGGLRSLGSNSYTLTPAGIQFTEAMIKRHGVEVDRQINTAAAARGGAAAANNRIGNIRTMSSLSSTGSLLDHHHPVPLGAPKLVLSTTKSQKLKHAEQDEQDLRVWAESATIGQQKAFAVGKQRRQRLHDLCDMINRKLQPYGRQLTHESVDASSRSRTLYVTVVPTTAAIGSHHNATLPTSQQMHWPTPDTSDDFDSTIEPSDDIDATILPWMLEKTTTATSPMRQRLYSSTGHTLGGGTDSMSGTPPKRSRIAIDNDDSKKLPPSVAAGLAAMQRQALFESKQQVRKKPAVAKKSTATVTNTSSTKIPESPQPPPICYIDDDDDDDDDDVPRAKSAAAVAKRPPTAQSTATTTIIRIPESPPLPPSVARARAVAPLLCLDSDDDDLDHPLHTKPAVATTLKHGMVEGSSALIVDLTEDEAAAAKQADRNSLLASSGTTRAITIVIDNRERNRNATPRVLRTELQRILTAGPLQQVWPVDMPPAVVEERELICGDFTVLHTPLAVERKRISDLVQRSARNAAQWEQLQRMREMDKEGFFLLEGSLQTAGQFQAFGLTDDDTMTVSSFAVYNDESLVRFVGRSILLSKTRFIQSRDEQGSLRAVASLALMACSSGGRCCNRNNAHESSAKVDIKRRRFEVIERLGGIPLAIAKRVADVIGSCREMDRLYNALPTDDIKDLVLEPVISDSIKAVPDNTCSAADWSVACHRAFRARNAGTVTETFRSAQTFVTNPAKLLVELHKGKSVDIAVDDILEDSSSILIQRRVYVELPEEYEGLLRECFPDSADAFYRVTTTPTLVEATTSTRPTCLPSVIFWAEVVGLDYRSDNVTMYILEGKSLVSRIEDSLRSGKGCFVEAARSLATELCRECNVCDCKWDNKDCALCSDSKSRPYQRTILLIRALYTALEQRAKQAGYRAEIRTIADLVLAELMLSRNMVVLQAVLRDADMKLFVSQMALSCFHFQLITRTSDVL